MMNLFDNLRLIYFIDINGIAVIINTFVIIIITIFAFSGYKKQMRYKTKIRYLNKLIKLLIELCHTIDTTFTVAFPVNMDKADNQLNKIQKLRIKFNYQSYLCEEYLKNNENWNREIKVLNDKLGELMGSAGMFIVYYYLPNDKTKDIKELYSSWKKNVYERERILTQTVDDAFLKDYVNKYAKPISKIIKNELKNG